MLIEYPVANIGDWVFKWYIRWQDLLLIYRSFLFYLGADERSIENVGIKQLPTNMDFETEILLTEGIDYMIKTNPLYHLHRAHKFWSEG